uniref:Uncharacterized protein n=1 Tax=Arundo donax TaxID=35708 RepID=A0A0A9FBP7_ARUDO
MSFSYGALGRNPSKSYDVT